MKIDLAEYSLSKGLVLDTSRYPIEKLAGGIIVIETDTTDPFMAKVGDVGLINVSGMLNPKYTFSGWLTAYRDITAAIDYFNGDKETKKIGLIIDSPGGTVAGVYGASNSISDSVKPVFAYATEGLCCSGAYWLASQAYKIYAEPHATLGSIGVKTMHMEYSKLLEEEGITVTEFGLGKKKNDGSPFKPLSASAKEDIEKDIQTTYDEFCETVKAGRSKVKKEVFQSGTYSGKEALDVGLVDGFIKSEEEFVTFLQQVE